jgi:hypothetical protein
MSLYLRSGLDSIPVSHPSFSMTCGPYLPFTCHLLGGRLRRNFRGGFPQRFANRIPVVHGDADASMSHGTLLHSDGRA